MNLKAVLAAGPAGVLALGGGIMYVQHEIHYLLRPSVMETLAGIAAVGGALLWSRNHASKKAEAEQEAPAPPAVVQAPTEAPKPLPQARPIDYPNNVQRQRQRKI